MKKLNLKIISLSFIVTAILLFGSWYGLGFIGVEKPIKEWSSQRDGIEIEELHVNQKEIQIQVDFEKNKEFGLSYLQFLSFLEETSKGRVVDIKIVPQKSEQHQWWLNHSAQIIENMDHQHYSTIADLLAQWVDQGIVKDASFMMNSDYLFIYIQLQEEDELYVVYPLAEERGVNT